MIFRDPNLSNLHSKHQPGEVVRLEDNIGQIVPGFYVIGEIDFLATIHLLGENEDGDLCSLYTSHRVTLVELEQFKSMELVIDPPLG